LTEVNAAAGQARTVRWIVLVFVGSMNVIQHLVSSMFFMLCRCTLQQDML